MGKTNNLEIWDNPFDILKGETLTSSVFSLGFFSVVPTTWFVWRTTWLVPGNPLAPLGLNSNYDIHSGTRLISN